MGCFEQGLIYEVCGVDLMCYQRYLFVVADEIYPIPFAAEESKLVPEVAAEKRFELADDDSKFCSFVADD